jgi:hypothetical protein
MKSLIFPNTDVKYPAERVPRERLAPGVLSPAEEDG